MDFKFPINKKDNGSYTTEELFGLLAKESTGHYLLGNHNFWHGGIHFTNTSASQCVTDEPVRCIADGEVIAYRINDNYIVSDYMMERDKNVCNKDDIMLLYSNSFCLIKHDYQSAAKETPKAADAAENWVGRYFILTEDRKVRDASTVDNAKCTFTGSLPKDSKIKILEMAEPGEKYTIAKVTIISIAGNKNTIANSHPNATPDKGSVQGTRSITKTIGDEVYIGAFDNKGKILINNKIPLLKEYTPVEALLNKTFKLNIDTPAQISKTDNGLVASDSLSVAMDAKNILLGSSPSNNIPSPTAKPDNRYVLVYVATLPKDMQVQLLTCQGTNASVKITRPVKARLITVTTSTTAAKEIELAAGEVVTITLFKSDNETIETYTIPAQGKTPATTTPIAEQTSNAESWNDQMIILEKDTKASNDLEPPKQITFLLPAGTKLKITSTNETTAQSNYTTAELLHDVKVITSEGHQMTLQEGHSLKIDLFDYYDNLKEPITKTNDPAPLKNTLTFYSLYMHLLPSEEYKEDLKFPSYWQGKITAKVTTELQTYTNGETKVKGAVMATNGVFEYDPTITATLQTTNTTTKRTETLTLTKCTYKSGVFKGRVTLKTEDIFWAVIDNKTSTTTKVIPNNPNIINCPTKPHPIKAGDPIGYLGTYQTPMIKAQKVPTPSVTPLAQVNDKLQLHLEIFVTDQRELENFIKNKARLDTGKKYLKILSSVNLITNKELITGKKAKQLTQPVVQNQQITEPQPIKTNFIVLQKDYLFELDKLKTYKDDKAVLWYEVTVTQNNEAITGYIKEGTFRTKIITQHDWEELGFTIVKENSENADGFVDQNKDKITPFFKDLYNQLDTNKDGKISREELKQTLTNTALRNRWSKLIGYHPTEWQAESTNNKWSILNTLLEDNKELLRHEKERIDKLIFWDKVPEIAATPQVFHFHPVAFFEHLNILWCDPLKYPQRTYYNSERIVRPQNGAFGWVRNGGSKTHQGLDLFADLNTPCFACLDGEIVQFVNEGNNGYGNVLVIKVKGGDLRAAKNKYKLEFSQEKTSGPDFNLNADYFYLRYCHLDSKQVKSLGKVKKGELVAYTSDSGNAKGVINPHLHFEIAMKVNGNGRGLSNRYNAAFFVNLNSIDIEQQTKVKNRRIAEK